MMSRSEIEKEVQDAYRAVPVRITHHSATKMSADSSHQVAAAWTRFLELADQVPTGLNFHDLLTTVHMKPGMSRPGVG
ncbi:hypothetical protein [Parasphingorhabdus sp.]|uniref:hypothetical protein n=1 Tax=Parasphingorhabdus sp. TaxID=2709688 RepID=UPI003593C5FD